MKAKDVIKSFVTQQLGNGFNAVSFLRRRSILSVLTPQEQLDILRCDRPLLVKYIQRCNVFLLSCQQRLKKVGVLLKYTPLFSFDVLGISLFKSITIQMVGSNDNKMPTEVML